MAFEFSSDDERIALAGTDPEVYPHLGIINTSRWKLNEQYDPRFRMSDPDELKITGYHYSGQPGMLPLALRDLEKFANCLISLTGNWVVNWNGATLDNHDHVNADGFRCVVACGVVDLTIRPLQDSGGGPRLAFTPGDVRACVDAAADTILKADHKNSIAGVIGRGSMASTEIPFEWQVAHAPEDMRARRVQRWRYKVCGSARAYTARESLYLISLRHSGLPDPRAGQRTFHNQGYQRRKRSNLEMAVREEMGPSVKRRDTGSSQWSSDSQSSFSSPSVASSWGQPIMGPPPPVGPGQPGTSIEHMFRYEQSRTGSRGSRGSTGSAASRVGAGLEGLTFQSPVEGSPEGVAPPPAGSPWGGPQGEATRVPEQFGRGFEAQAPFYGQQGQGFAPQIPAPGYQGPGQVQQAPAPGQLENVYGYLVPAGPGRPRGPPQVGIAHTQHFAAHGGWSPQHPGQPQVPAGLAPGQHSYQSGHAGFVDTQSGMGYAGGSGHNVPAFGGSNVQGGGGYPPGFPPPTQQAMHGGQFASPHQPQHRAAVPPERRDDPSVLPNVPRTASPQPHFPSGAKPMRHHQDIQPLPPPAMRNIDPAQFQAQPPLPPVAQNYPSSLPPATHSMRAEPILAPEHEDVPADSESESESEGEDDRVSHQDTRVTTQPLLHTGGQGDPRVYESPPAMPQDPSDVFMGAGASDDDAPDEDNFHRR